MKVGGGLEEEEDVQPDVSHSRSMRHAFRSLSQYLNDSRKRFFLYNVGILPVVWAKVDHLMETSHLKAILLGSRYLEWMSNFPLGTWP